MKTLIAIALGIAAASLMPTTSSAAIKHNISSHHRPFMVSKVNPHARTLARSAPAAPAASIAETAPAALLAYFEGEEDDFESP